MHHGWRGLVVFLLIGLGVIEPALAHKVKVFASVEGAVISGYAYYPGGGRAMHVPVRLFDPSGAGLGETTTDGEGRFRFTATARVDHRIMVDAGEGHLAEFMVSSADLPETLVTPVAVAPPAAALQAIPAAPAPAAADALQELIEKGVARQLRPLREQLEAYEERLRWRDVLGGIGYIAGLAGLGFFLLGRRPPTG